MQLKLYWPQGGKCGTHLHGEHRTDVGQQRKLDHARDHDDHARESAPPGGADAAQTVAELVAVVAAVEHDFLPIQHLVHCHLTLVWDAQCTRGVSTATAGYVQRRQQLLPR